MHLNARPRRGAYIDNFMYIGAHTSLCERHTYTLLAQLYTSDVAVTLTPKDFVGCLNSFNFTPPPYWIYMSVTLWLYIRCLVMFETVQDSLRLYSFLLLYIFLLWLRHYLFLYFITVVTDLLICVFIIYLNSIWLDWPFKWSKIVTY